MTSCVAIVSSVIKKGYTDISRHHYGYLFLNVGLNCGSHKNEHHRIPVQ